MVIMILIVIMLLLLYSGCVWIVLERRDRHTSSTECFNTSPTVTPGLVQ